MSRFLNIILCHSVREITIIEKDIGNEKSKTFSKSDLSEIDCMKSPR